MSLNGKIKHFKDVTLKGVFITDKKYINSSIEKNKYLNRKYVYTWKSLGRITLEIAPRTLN